MATATLPIDMDQNLTEVTNLATICSREKAEGCFRQRPSEACPDTSKAGEEQKRNAQDKVDRQREPVPCDQPLRNNLPQEQEQEQKWLRDLPQGPGGLRFRRCSLRTGRGMCL